MSERPDLDLFRREDVSFAVATEVIDGVLTWVVLYENCRTSQCQLVIWLTTIGSTLQHSMVIECKGGAAGTQRSPWPVPSGFTGLVERFEVYADVMRPDGAGDLIKQPAGKPVEPTSAPGNEFLVNLFMAVVARHVLFRPPATVEVFIPANVAAEVPGTTSPQDLLLPFLIRSPSFWFLVIFLALAAFAMFWPH